MRYLICFSLKFLICKIVFKEPRYEKEKEAVVVQLKQLIKSVICSFRVYVVVAMVLRTEEGTA